MHSTEKILCSVLTLCCLYYELFLSKIIKFHLSTVEWGFIGLEELYEIWGSHGGEEVGVGLLVFNDVWTSG
jgi:hypothetical protein